LSWPKLEIVPFENELSRVTFIGLLLDNQLINELFGFVFAIPKLWFQKNNVDDYSWLLVKFKHRNDQG